LKTLVREPLLHFLLLGAVLFVVYGLVSRHANDEPGRIHITQAQIAAMADGFTRTWRRPPLREELDGLIRDRIREEVSYREAMALGLDKDDTIIRRRLRQKLEFISEDIVAPEQPGEADLNAYLLAHPEQFRVAQTFTFKQIYLDPARHGDNLARDSAQLIERLQRAGDGADISAFGDPWMLEQRFTAERDSEVAKQFGSEFAARLAELPVGKWQGPIKSGLGVHLVLLDERMQARVPALAEVRDAVVREWTNTRRAEANEKFFQELLKRYTVTIEPERPVTEPEKVVDAP
jgi:hypothetical protein